MPKGIHLSPQDAMHTGSRMKLGYRTVAFRNLDLRSALNEIARIGYDGIELCLECHGLSDPPMKRAVRSAVSSASGEGLEIASFSDHRNLLDDRNAELICRELEAAVELGAGIFIVSSAPAGSPGGLHALAGACDSLLEIAGSDVKVAIEPEPRLLVEGSKDFERLRDKLAYGRSLCMNLDIGHAVCVGESMEALLPRYAKEIVHYHVEDIAGRIHRHLVPGEGEIDLAATLSHIARHHRDGYLTVDLFDAPDPPLAASRALQYLEPLLGRL